MSIPEFSPFDILRFMNGRGIEITNNDKVRETSLRLGPFTDLNGHPLVEKLCNMDLSDQPDMKDLDYIFTDTLHFSEAPGDVMKAYTSRLKPGGVVLYARPNAAHSPRLGEFGCPAEWKSAGLPCSNDSYLGTFRRAGIVWDFFAIGIAAKEAETSPKTIAVCRLGAFGDHLMASSILPALRAKYPDHRLVYITNSNGEVTLRHNPHIDQIICFPGDTLGVMQMWPFFDWVNRRWPLNVNLNFETETRLLHPPQCITHKHSKEVRHELSNHNYVEWQHRIAGLDGTDLSYHFYDTEAEQQDAHELLGWSPSEPTIGIVIHGSSPNKFWPHAPALVTRLMHTLPGARFVLFGEGKGAADASAHLLEVVQRYYGATDRVINLANKTSIRQALSISKLCDIIVGPETALTNCVAWEPEVFKVVLLSHSTVENFTRDWPNTVSLAAQALPCYPCHMLHFTFEFCNKSAKGDWAQCAENISVGVVERVILQYWNAKHPNP